MTRVGSLTATVDVEDHKRIVTQIELLPVCVQVEVLDLPIGLVSRAVGAGCVTEKEIRAWVKKHKGEI